MGGYNDELKKAGRDVAQARLRVMGDAQQRPGAAGREGPVRHHQHVMKFWKYVASYRMRA